MTGTRGNTEVGAVSILTSHEPPPFSPPAPAVVLIFTLDRGRREDNEIQEGKEWLWPMVGHKDAKREERRKLMSSQV